METLKIASWKDAGVNNKVSILKKGDYKKEST